MIKTLRKISIVICLISTFLLSIEEIDTEIKTEQIKPKVIVTEPLEIIVHTVEKKYYETELSEDIQDYIISVCQGYNIAPEIVIAIIERESRCKADATGDSGRSIGLMQIQKRWHTERMERLGCDDLSDAYQNVLVGIDYLHELFEINDDLYWVLMAYNGGMRYATERMKSGNYSNYAVEISERAEELETLRKAEYEYRNNV